MRFQRWTKVEPDGRTRLEIRGWLEALEKLDATLLHIQPAATDAVV